MKIEHTKFLGVLINDKLTWPYLNSLLKTYLLHRKIESHYTIHSLNAQTTTQTFVSPFLNAISRMEYQSVEVLTAKPPKLKTSFKGTEKSCVI